MQPDRAAKRDSHDDASHATVHVHETRERLPIRQSTPAGSNASSPEKEVDKCCCKGMECNNRPFRPGRHVAPEVAMMLKDAKPLDLVVKWNRWKKLAKLRRWDVRSALRLAWP